MKRTRVDGQISREEYETSEFESGSKASFFSKATPNTLASRRIVFGRRQDKKREFIRHIKALNSSIRDWFVGEVRKNGNCDLRDGAQDYIDYVSQLEDRYLRKHGEVLTFGSGDCGQLAHGVDRDEDLMVKFPRIVYSLRDKKVCGISCGGLHNAVYTEDGLVYTWGCADDGSLGREGDESIPGLVPLGDAGANPVIAVACGDGQTIAVTTSGEVWGWGCYKDKEGKKWFNASPAAANPVKDVKKQQNAPLKLSGLSDIIEVCCGSAFCMARADDGTVYSWGLGECGELGREVPPMKKGVGEEAEYDLQSIYNHHVTAGPMYLAPENSSSSTSSGGSASALVAVRDAKTIGCGSYHAFVVQVGGRVLSCGLNNYAQLGLGDDTPRPPFLHEVKVLGGIGVISAKGGVHHSLVLTSTGQLLAFGRGDSGQLGVRGQCDTTAGAFATVPVVPVVTTAPGVKVVSIACGGNHNLAMTSDNAVYSWGYGDMLALGHGEERDELAPKKVNFSKARIDNISVTQVSGGGQHSAIVGVVLGTQ